MGKGGGGFFMNVGYFFGVDLLFGGGMEGEDECELG